MFQVFSCSYNENWTSDQQGVYFESVPCRANAPLNIQLKPGEAYERDLSLGVLFAAKELPQQPLTFRLGFTAWIDPPAKSLPLIWSNPITVKVIP